MPSKINICLVPEHFQAISPDLFGIFFEDLNYAADGGLYAELIQNRSFEYQATEQATWNSLTSWELVVRGGGQGTLKIDAAIPIHPNNPHYAVLQVTNPAEGVGLLNDGFGGIPVRDGQSYNLSLFARHLYKGERWAPHENVSSSNPPDYLNQGALVARLERKNGEVLGEISLPCPGKEWTHLEATMTVTGTENAARFVLLATEKGGWALDVISLFPQETFKNRPKGLRADLAQCIAELKPKFVRFPGGCLVHGNGLGNIYRWKDTIGPVEQRKEQANLWGYHQTVGLGYFEYFLFCEDIGAKPLPIVAAGVSCQNSGYTGGTGQKGLPLEEMPAYIQDVLDLIEWANGPATSTWGAKRAEAGHPKPFGLQYLGIGNEDHITPVFRERFAMIEAAVKARHPEITVIGTVGPFHSGNDYEEGWKIAQELSVDMVDEHYYETSNWFWKNLGRYDGYERGATSVYVGEYAAHEPDRKNTLRSALAEAAYMTSLERNGDVVHLASYAPLLAKVGNTQWAPDLIYFDNVTVFPTFNYYVQQLFATNAGDIYLSVQASGEDTSETFATSAVRDSVTGDLILKFVSRAAESTQVQVDLGTIVPTETKATCVVLEDDSRKEEAIIASEPILPKVSTIFVENQFTYHAPAHSLSIVRIKTNS